MDYKVIVTKKADKYILYINELQLIASGDSLDFAYQELNRKKVELLKEFEEDGHQKELETLAVKVRNGEIPPAEVFDHFKNNEFLKYFKDKYRKEIRGMSPDYLRKIGYKKPTKKER